MGCFFGCFRVRDERRPPLHILSQPISSTIKDPVGSGARNRRLSSLLLFEDEDRDESLCTDRKRDDVRAADDDINLNELKAEAKFLKICGTLPQTPAEIRNNEKLKDTETLNRDTESSTFHSWLPNVSNEKLKQEKQTDHRPSPVKLFEEWENGSDSSSRSPDSCLIWQNSESVQRKHLPVRFDCEIDVSSYSFNSSSSGVTCQESKASGLSGDYSVSKPSPYPTPITLTDDIQTPGTVFPSYLHNKEIGKNPRIRSQYVYSVLKPVENAAQLRKLVEESFGSDNYSAQMEEQLEKGANTAGKELNLNVDTSLSSWLPSKQSHQFGNNRSFIGKTPGDRPILGMVAAHWNADETVSSPPKWWDGNGIPNSTNKYKEDQKVSWHATPFEERLEKALSEDKLIAERRQLGTTPPLPINLDEKEKREPASHFESGFILINSS